MLGFSTSFLTAVFISIIVVTLLGVIGKKSDRPIIRLVSKIIQKEKFIIVGVYIVVATWYNEKLIIDKFKNDLASLDHNNTLYMFEVGNLRTSSYQLENMKLNQYLYRDSARFRRLLSIVYFAEINSSINAIFLLKESIGEDTSAFNLSQYKLDSTVRALTSRYSIDTLEMLRTIFRDSLNRIEFNYQNIRNNLAIDINKKIERNNMAYYFLYLIGGLIIIIDKGHRYYSEENKHDFVGFPFFRSVEK